MGIIGSEYRLKMPDGIHLYTWVFTPAQTGKFPVVFFRTPYTEGTGLACGPNAEDHVLLEAGYACVHQHCRGRGESEGVFDAMIREAPDGLNTLEWMREQPWYGAQVYLVGFSYTSYVHLAILSDPPADVKGAMLGVMPTHMYEGMYAHGVWKNDLQTPWMLSLHLPQVHPHMHMEEGVALMRAAIHHRPALEADRFALGEEKAWHRLAKNAPTKEDPHWREGEVGKIREGWKRNQVPVLMIDGWFEMFLEGMLLDWTDLPEATRMRSAFLIGPWSHSCTPESGCPLALPDAAIPLEQLMLS